ncbi:MAG: ArsA family ATPase [Anaerolineaceae bacterium]|nr:ArsA family ATPase [Anaerolineaceae bacterium]
MRIIVHTGKGGTGKTSISAATGLRCAQAGLKTLVISTDAAHSLADSFERDIGPEPVALAQNLWAQEVDLRHSMERYWGDIQRRLLTMFRHPELEDLVAGEVTLLPGLEEGAHLLWINRYYEQGDFDVLVVDAAPTAETLRLLSLPDVTRWWFSRIVTLARGASRVLGPLNRARGKDHDGGDAVAQLEMLFATLDRVRELLADPRVSSMRLVVNPERMVIRETQRTWTCLNLYGYAVDAVICNRLLPDEVRDPWFAAAKKRQAENLALIRESFGELPLLTAPLLGVEAGGLASLQQLGDALYGQRNPADPMHDGETHRISSAPDGGYLLSVPLPFTRHDDLELYREHDELTLQVGRWRRNFVLPHSLAGLEIGVARFEDACLKIHFRAAKRTPAAR